MWIRTAIKLPHDLGVCQKTVGNSAGDFYGGGERKTPTSWIRTAIKSPTSKSPCIWWKSLTSPWETITVRIGLKLHSQRLCSHCRQMWPKSNFFAHMWLRSVFVMTVWTAQTAWNLIFSIPICATSAAFTGQMFCNATTVWTVMSEFMQILHHYRSTFVIIPCWWEVWCVRTHKNCSDNSIYKQNMRAQKVSKLFCVLSHPCLYFSYCLHIISPASAADHTINKHIIAFCVHFHMPARCTSVAKSTVSGPAELGYFFHCCRGMFFNFVGWRDPTNAIFTPLNMVGLVLD